MTSKKFAFERKTLFVTNYLVYKLLYYLKVVHLEKQVFKRATTREKTLSEAKRKKMRNSFWVNQKLKDHFICAQNSISLQLSFPE